MNSAPPPAAHLPVATPATPAMPATDLAPRGTVLEVLWAFLRLGLTSFGGPVAHLGYFRTEFVERRRWLDDQRYSDLVALCQFLPGPASSQVGIALGLGRAGWGGAAGGPGFFRQTWRQHNRCRGARAITAWPHAAAETPWTS